MAANEFLKSNDPVKVKQPDGSFLTGIFKEYHDDKSKVQICHTAGEKPNPVISVDNDDIFAINCG